MTSHEHCRKCFMSSCTHAKGCSFVYCQLKCGMSMHNCKLSDHRNVCQNEQIACINSHYGCPAKILRSRLSLHLTKCPANVILCTMEWGRYPLHSQDRLRWVPFVQRNPKLVKGCLDVELAMRDQQVINRSRGEKYKRGLLKRLPGRFESEIKLSYERAMTVRQEILEKRDKSLMEQNNEVLTLVSANEVCDKNLDQCTTSVAENKVSINIPNCPEFSEQNLEEPTNFAAEHKVSSSIPNCPEYLNQYTGLGVNINLETIPSFMRHKFMYRIPCTQLLQRRQFPTHFKNVHSDIHGGMGWMEQRCPLAQYGCTFVRNRLCPLSQEGTVVFSQDQGAFGIQPLKAVAVTPQLCYLLCLPCEVLEVICEWLDSFSIRNLAMTCKGLYETLHNLLPRRGVVVLKWKKRKYEDGSSSWVVSDKCWSFTSAFAEVHQWVHSDTPIMSAHLENCSYYHQYRAQRPFTYEVCYIPGEV